MNNHGNVIVSLGAMCAWLAPQAEALGVEIYPGFAAAEPLHDDDGRGGVRIGDMGVAKDGSHKPGYTQGIDIRAKVTVLAEGARGHLTKRLVKRFGLDADSDPQTYSIGIKELWQVPDGRVSPGKIVHTLGWPLTPAPMAAASSTTWTRTGSRSATSRARLHRSELPPYEAFQQWKHHPTIKPLLEGGNILSAGARAIVTGGYQSLPKVEMPGALLIGDTAGLLNVPKIKGTHQAMRSGMLAAEHLAARARRGLRREAARLGGDGRAAPVRNIKPGFKKGLWFGLLNAAWETAHRRPLAVDAEGQARLVLAGQARRRTTRRTRDWVERDLPPRDRLAGVYFAATEHDEDQPVHLQVPTPRSASPAAPRSTATPAPASARPASTRSSTTTAGHGKRLQINAANCVHCKTCDIKDPYEIITG
jgi:electron-transferring-flavoprotein dehydrogenase